MGGFLFGGKTKSAFKEAPSPKAGRYGSPGFFLLLDRACLYPPLPQKTPDKVRAFFGLSARCGRSPRQPPSRGPESPKGPPDLSGDPAGPVSRLAATEGVFPLCRFSHVSSFLRPLLHLPAARFQLSRKRQKNRRIPGPPVFVSFRGGDRRSFPFLLSSFFFIRFSADFKDGKFSPAGSAAERRRKRLCSVFSGQIFPLHYI